jgi:predicted RND superfamily exporter protein
LTTDQATSDAWADELAKFDCVVVASDHPTYDLAFIRAHSKHVIDARDHQFDPQSPQAVTAAQLHNGGDGDAGVFAVYTGIVPIVYKAQRALLNSLVNSIGLAFATIALVMMILLRRWKEPLSPTNVINIRGGMTAMIPNVFPMVLVFGLMGHWGTKVDIGSMMTASVAMGVAVDDTIHFLNWFRLGLGEGLGRKDAIRLAYRRVATAMTQTTAIGGLGLYVFAMSTFTPTQRFGVLMLTLLTAALLGDLVLLPAILAGPLGRFFEVRRRTRGQAPVEDSAPVQPSEAVARAETPHSSAKLQGKETTAILRRDPGGERLTP